MRVHLLLGRATQWTWTLRRPQLCGCHMRGRQRASAATHGIATRGARAPPARVAATTRGTPSGPMVGPTASVDPAAPMGGTGAARAKAPGRPSALPAGMQSVGPPSPAEGLERGAQEATGGPLASQTARSAAAAAGRGGAAGGRRASPSAARRGASPTLGPLRRGCRRQGTAGPAATHNTEPHSLSRTVWQPGIGRLLQVASWCWAAHVAEGARFTVQGGNLVVGMSLGWVCVPVLCSRADRTIWRMHRAYAGLGLRCAVTLRLHSTATFMQTKVQCGTAEWLDMRKHALLQHNTKKVRVETRTSVSNNYVVFFRAANTQHRQPASRL